MRILTQLTRWFTAFHELTIVFERPHFILNQLVGAMHVTVNSLENGP